MESKVDELADQLKDLILMIEGMRKAEKIVEFKKDDRVCSYCRKPEHTANRCQSNPHRNTRCSNCNKIGHLAATCWSAKRENGQKAPSALTTAQSKSQAEMRLQTKETPSLVSFVGVVDDEDVVATTKRTAEGEPLPKQPRSEGPKKYMSELTRTVVETPSRSPSVPTIGNTQQKMLRTYGVLKTAEKPKSKLSDVHFVVVTDHHALSYAFKKKDIRGRLARWIDLLAEYDLLFNIALVRRTPQQISSHDRPTQ